MAGILSIYTPSDFKQWDVWDIDWKHEDLPHEASSRHLAIVISSRQQLGAESFVRFLKISGTDPHPREKMIVTPSMHGMREIGITKDCFVHLASEQHYPMTKPPIWIWKGRIPSMMAALLELALRKVQGRDPYLFKPDTQ